MIEPLTIRPLTAAGVSAVHAELVELYALCYADPPYSEGPDELAAYAVRLLDWAAEDGFTGLFAHATDGRLAGAAYGWFGPPRAGGLAMPGIDHARVFHVSDLMVHPAHRRRRLGRRLLDRLVADRRPAVLVTHPDGDARRLYETAGWRHAGTVTPRGSWPMRVYALELDRKSRA